MPSQSTHIIWGQSTHIIWDTGVILLLSTKAYLYLSIPLQPTPRISSSGVQRAALHMSKPSVSLPSACPPREATPASPDNLVPNLITLVEFSYRLKLGGKPPFHPSNPNAMCEIIVDVSTSLDYRPKILKTFFLRNDLCGKSHFHICLIQTSSNLHLKYFVLVLLNRPFGLRLVSTPTTSH
ncbi:hypothetical protein H5410_063928 [Solanum commersonii]|uniref:Uncharacterized protein n=1 Tax=Solanum commersonii TaxID=4109 RepID=A0A9J5WEX8_SOLCO|nr:hypothetical protein H5410_063928 [Solanum commersonii]